MTIQQVLDEGRLIRRAWSREEDGRQLLCLYTALVGDPDARPHTCPASLCQQWLAHLLPWIDDNGTEERWLEVVARVATLALRFVELPPETEWRVRALIVREAMRYGGDPKGVCSRVAELCDRKGRGEDVSDDELSAAESAAWRAAGSTAASAAASAAWSAAWSAAASAAFVAESAAASAAASAARSAARSAQSDKIIDLILDEIERSLP